MDYSTQIIMIIFTAIIMATLIVGVILLAVGIHHIKTTLRDRNEMLLQTNRPYLVCQKNGEQLYIKNLGNMLAQIDSLTASDGTDFSYLGQQYIASGQTFTYKIDKAAKFTLELRYHGQLEEYSETFEI